MILDTGFVERKNESIREDWMSQADLKIENYRAMKLGLLPVVAISVRQPAPPVAEGHQSLSIELLNNRLREHVVLEFSGLRQLRLADLHSGVLCYLDVSSVVSDQMEGLRYRVSNIEQDFTLSFYCADFSVSNRSLP